MSDTPEAPKLPRTAKEALIAELLGDVEVLLNRADSVGNTINNATVALAATAAALDDGGDKYRLAITAFTEQAKIAIARSLEHAIAKTNEEERAAMQEAARLAFRSEASDRAADLARVLENAVRDLSQSRLTRLTESAIIAGVSSLVTALLVYFIAR